MTAPRHHPPEALLVDYASGAAPEAIALLVATHLALCPRCRDDVDLLERIGGALLEEIPALPMAQAALLDAKDQAARARPHRLEPRRPVPDDLLMFPEPLRAYLAPKGEVKWTLAMPGFRYCELDVQYGGVPVRVSSLAGGFSVPRHTHEGLELNLVLHGGFTDRGDDYLRGDVAVGDATVTHHLDIHRGESCVLLAVNEHKLVPTTLAGRILTRLLPM